MIRTLVGLIAVALLGATSAMAQGVVPSPSRTNPFGRAQLATAVHALGQQVTPGLSQSEWQRQHDKALADKATAKRNMLIGFGAMGAGLAVVMIGVGSCDDLDDVLDGCTGAGSGVMLGNLIWLGGAGFGGYGWYQFTRANNKLDLLDVQKASGRVAALVPLSDRHSIVVSRTGVGYRLAW